MTREGETKRLAATEQNISALDRFRLDRHLYTPTERTLLDALRDNDLPSDLHIQAIDVLLNPTFDAVSDISQQTGKIMHNFPMDFIDRVRADKKRPFIFNTNSAAVAAGKLPIYISQIEQEEVISGRWDRAGYNRVIEDVVPFLKPQEARDLLTQYILYPYEPGQPHLYPGLKRIMTTPHIKPEVKLDLQQRAFAQMKQEEADGTATHDLWHTYSDIVTDIGLYMSKATTQEIKHVYTQQFTTIGIDALQRMQELRPGVPAIADRDALTTITKSILGNFTGDLNPIVERWTRQPSTMRTLLANTITFLDIAMQYRGDPTRDVLYIGIDEDKDLILEIHSDLHVMYSHLGYIQGVDLDFRGHIDAALKRINGVYIILERYLHDYAARIEEEKQSKLDEKKRIKIEKSKKRFSKHLGAASEDRPTRRL